MSTRVDLTQDPQPGAGALVPLNERPDTPEEARQAKVSLQKGQPRLAQYILNVCDEIDRLDDAERLRIRKSQVRCCMYYDGRQYGEVRDDGEWYDFERSPGDIRPVDNDYKKQIDKLNMEMDRARTELEVEAGNPNDSAMVEGAKFLEARLRANRTRILTAQFVQSENSALLLKTLTFRYTSFNPTTGPRRRKIPIIEEGETLHHDTPPICVGCGMTRNPALTGQPCPDCGETKVKSLSSGGQKTVKAKEWQQGPVGRVETLHIDPLMVNMWLGARHGLGGQQNSVASSPFIVLEQSLFRCQVEAHYPDRILPSTGSSTTVNDAARFAWDLERWPSNSGEGGILTRGDDTGRGGGTKFERIRYRLYWLDPVLYADYRGNYEETLPDGTTIAPGAEITPHMPDGMLVARVENTILDLQPEDKNKKWSMAPYGLREHALHGSGTNALLGPQDTVNDIESYIVANIFYNMAPREFVRKDAIEGGQLPAANEVAIVTNLGEGENIIGYAYAKAEPSPLPGEVFEYREGKRGSMQDAAGTSSLSSEGSAPDVKAMGTATGVAAIRDQAVGRMGPPLRLKAAMDIEHGYQIGEHEQAAARANKFYFSGLISEMPIAEKGNLSYSQRGLEAFMASEDIRSDFIIKAKEGSWMPATDAEESANFTAFGQVAAQAGPLLGDPDETTDLANEILSRAAAIYRQPLNLGGWNATERAAAERLTAVARTVKIMERKGYGMPDPRLAEQAIKITPGCGVNVEMDKHPAFINFYKEWFVSDEGRRASKLLKLTVETLKQQHEEGWIYQLQQDDKRKLAAQAPSLAAMEEANKAKAAETPPEENETEGKAMLADQAAQHTLEAQEQAAKHKLAQQEQAAELKKETDAHKAKLDLALQSHKAELESEDEEERHGREVADQSRQAGQERINAMLERGRSEKDKEADQEHELTKMAAEHGHQTSLERIKNAGKSKPPSKGAKK